MGNRTGQHCRRRGACDGGRGGGRCRRRCRQDSCLRLAGRPPVPVGCEPGSVYLRNRRGRSPERFCVPGQTSNTIPDPICVQTQSSMATSTMANHERLCTRKHHDSVHGLAPKYSVHIAVHARKHHDSVYSVVYERKHHDSVHGFAAKYSVYWDEHGTRPPT